MIRECDYPKVKRLLLRGRMLVGAVQDTFEGRTYRQIDGHVRAGEVYSREIHCSAEPRAATTENNMAIANFRVVEAVHPNTVRAILRRAGKADNKLCPGSWYRVIED